MSAVLVTGARSGFGKLIAIEAARKGMTVYAGLRDLDTQGDLVADAAGLPVIPVQLDVTDAEQRREVVARIVGEHGGLHGLVNNAGVALGGFLEQIDEDEIRRLFDVNVFGVWGMTKEVLPSMRAARSGKIIMISSMGGIVALPGLGAYGASKFAVEGMTEAWRHEIASFGIDIYLVEPGPYRTDMYARNRIEARRARDEDSPYAAMVRKLDRLVAERVSTTARPADEVAHHVVKLLTSKRTHLRHPMGPGSIQRVLAKRLLPFSAVEMAVRRALAED